MNVRMTGLPGVMLIEPNVHEDDRGFFLETYQKTRYEAALGHALEFTQDNHSRSHKRVIRGLHLQRQRPQAKLMRVARGAVFDVAVDVDPGSPNFGRWVSAILSEDNKHQLFVPAGYAHGFQVISEIADLEYKCIGDYVPEDEVGVLWNDAELGIPWPLADALLSAKDACLPTLSSLCTERAQA